MRERRKQEPALGLLEEEVNERQWMNVSFCQHGRKASTLIDVLIVVLSAVAFVALFSVTQWYFSKFLLSDYGQNWFFAADRHWGYTESLGEWRTKFWDAKTSRNEPTATLSTFALSLAYALASSALGLALGNWMAKVRR